MRYIDLSHEILDGLVTYPGLMPPSIRPEMSFDDSRSHYADGYEFQIDRIDMVANTGTYIDTPAHRFRGGLDLAGLKLDEIADLATIVVSTSSQTIGADEVPGRNLTGHAVLFHTGWSRHWGTAQYGQGSPHLGTDAAAELIERGVALVGIDSLNIDSTASGERPIHTSLLKAGIPIVEHLTNLDALPSTGARFFAVPPKVRGMGSFPVRAFAVVGRVDGTDTA